MNAYQVMLGLMLVCAIPARAQPKFPPVLTACSAFALDGTSVTAGVTSGSLSLSLKNPSGKESTLTLSLRYQPDQSQVDRPSVRWRVHDCSLFFNHSSNLLAVGITTGFPIVLKLQVAVADLKTLSWLSDFGVEQSPGPNGAVKLVGFLQDTDSIVVTEARHTNEIGSVSTLLFDPRGKQLSAEPAVRSWQEPLLPFYADATSNRLWLFHCVMVSARLSKQPSCPITVTNLVTDGGFNATFDPSHYDANRTHLWMTPATFASPDPNTILISESVGGDDTVWRVDIQKQTLDRFVLPEHHFLKYNAMHDGVLSPDRKVCALLRSQYKIAFPYMVDNYIYKGDDVVVIQVMPLRLLGIVPYRGANFTRGLAVDHRNGRATVLVYQQDRWEHYDFNDIEP